MRSWNPLGYIIVIPESGERQINWAGIVHTGCFGPLCGWVWWECCMGWSGCVGISSIKGLVWQIRSTNRAMGNMVSLLVNPYVF